MISSKTWGGVKYCRAELQWANPGATLDIVLEQVHSRGSGRATLRACAT